MARGVVVSTWSFQKKFFAFSLRVWKNKIPPEKRNGNDNEHRLEKIAKGAFLFFLFFYPPFTTIKHTKKNSHVCVWMLRTKEINLHERERTMAALLLYAYARL
jgi:hypothetical protein